MVCSRLLSGGLSIHGSSQISCVRIVSLFHVTTFLFTIETSRVCTDTRKQDQFPPCNNPRHHLKILHSSVHYHEFVFHIYFLHFTHYESLCTTELVSVKTVVGPLPQGPRSTSILFVPTTS